MPEFDSAELLRERNLLDIYRLSRKAPKPRFYLVLPSAIGVSLAAYSLWSGDTNSELAERARSWTEVGFSFSAAILGFLLAGFAIFATMMKTEFALDMARVVHPPSGLSYLKYNFSAFFDVFVKYLFFVMLYVVVLTLGYPKGPADALLGLLPCMGPFETRVLTSTFLGFVAGFLFHLLLILQSFVFNVYHVVMTSVQWEAEQESKRRDSDPSR